MKAIFLTAFLLGGCAAAQQNTLPTVGTALNGVAGFYNAVCKPDPLPEHTAACAEAKPYLNTVIEWYTVVNEGAAE